MLHVQPYTFGPTRSALRFLLCVFRGKQLASPARKAYNGWVYQAGATLLGLSAWGNKRGHDRILPAPGKNCLLHAAGFAARQKMPPFFSHRKTINAEIPAC